MVDGVATPIQEPNATFGVQIQGVDANSKTTQCAFGNLQSTNWADQANVQPTNWANQTTICQGDTRVRPAVPVTV